MPFPPDFLWGAATSSYQIEGAVHDDGRGQSIWDRFVREPGRVADGETGDVACDHYHRWAGDVDLMAEIGLRAYRFSIAWPRVFPDGGSQLNQRGLDFYRRLVDRLLQRGIAPVATLHHWDLPAQLQDQHGGWAGRPTVDRFAIFAETVMRALGDRVPLWITINEPWVLAMLGHFRGIHAPGRSDLDEALRAAHHLLLAHGRAVEIHRGLGLRSQVGIALSLQPTYPLADTEADRLAAHQSNGYTDRWFLDPVFGRGYPTDMLGVYGRHGADIGFDNDADQAVIAGPMDFLGINYYSRRVVSAGGGELGWTVREEPEPGSDVTGFGWEVVPDAMVDMFATLRRDYPPIPLYVTENGAAAREELAPDGTLDDPARIDFLRRHVGAMETAIAAGTDLRGYFVWSLLDNFEWSFGYWPRFGLVHVDYPTQRRVLKSSARWYSGLIAGNGLAGP